MPSASDLALAWKTIAHFFGEEAPSVTASPELLDRVATLHRLDAALAEPKLTPHSPEQRVPAELWAKWRGAHQGTLAQSLQRAEPLRAALAALAPLEAVVFKGAALAELVYPSPGARPMVDVDLLVRGKDAPDAAARLQALGYRCYYWGHPFFHRAYYYEWPLAGPDLEIDLHRGFTQAARVAADYGALFERSLPWPSLAPNARLLAPEDALIAQALQPARNELSPSGCPAIGLLDLKLMIEREGPFWGSAGGPALDLSEVARRAESWGAGAFVYAGLGYAVRLFPSLAARAAAAQPALPRWLSREIDRWIVDRAFPPPLADPRRRDVWLRKALVTSPGALARLAVQRAAGLATVFRRRLVEPRPRPERSVTPLGKRLFG